MDDAERVGLVRDAMRRAAEATAAGDAAVARDWLERALRLAPDYPAAMLALATLLLGRDDARAAGLFEAVLRDHDVREAWIGAAVARLRLGELPAAAAALAPALSRHVLVAADIAAVAASVAGAAGWCGLRGDGVVEISPGNAAELTLDGRTIAGSELPAGWRTARRLCVTRDGAHMLGSPIDIAAICAIEGCVAVADGGVTGWAWHPGDPGRDPVLTLRPAAGIGEPLQVTATEPAPQATSEAPLARPKAFAIAAAELAGFSGPIAVVGPDGRHLTGSPLDPGADRRAARAVATLYPAGPPRRGVGQPPVDVVIPVYRHAAGTLACIDAVLATRAAGSRVVVIDDASPEILLAAALDRLAARRRIVLIRHAVNQGFPAAANAGIRACAGRDVVLLNSDTLVPVGTTPAGGWLVRLRLAAYAAPDIGTVTPLSNDATLLNYPDPAGGNAMPDAAATARLDALAATVNAGQRIDIPTAIGFCMYIRRDCLDQVGAFRDDVFAQGYGEENDFCCRAASLGWRHVAAADVFVAHRGGQSFGAAKRRLLARNGAVLHRLHPGYEAAIERFGRADPLAAARRRLDEASWDEAATPRRRAVLLVTHDEGGGVERQIRARCAASEIAGQRPIVLRPTTFADSQGVRVGDGAGNEYPNLRYRLPAEVSALRRLLAAARPVRLELHHLLGHADGVVDLAAALRIPTEIHVHDYAAICPRMNLIGPDRRYCGEPAPAVCAACIADAGRNDGLDLPVAALRAGSAFRFAQAARIVVPSRDTASRLRRYFPAIQPDIVPHEDDGAVPPPPPSRARGKCRVVVAGAIGVEKGFDILLACARDAADRDLPIEFVVVGHTTDDARLLDTGRIFITGEYAEADAVALIRAQAASLAWVPSILPETWCFTLTEVWRAGLRAVAFDIGAPSERIRATGYGRVLPLGLKPAAINAALAREAGLS